MTLNLSVIQYWLIHSNISSKSSQFGLQMHSLNSKKEYKSLLDYSSRFKLAKQKRQIKNINISIFAITLSIMI